jgi:hypothetical protein
LPIGILTVHALSYRFVSDDAYITFRYSWNLAYHGEIAFNLGDRVEGYTNFLWMALLAFFLKLGLRPDIMSQVLGVLFGAVGIVLIYVLTRLYRGGRPNPWDLLGALLLPTVASFTIWCMGGLETQLFTALVLGGIVLYMAESGDGSRLRWRYSGALFALATMTRPEGALFFGLTGLHLLLRNLIGQRRILPTAQEVVWVVSYVVPVGLFVWWRYDYYGFPFPNTFYVKGTVDKVVMLKKWGLPYLWDFIHFNRLYVVAPFLLLLWPRTTWFRRPKQAEQLASEGKETGKDWLAAEKGFMGYRVDEVTPVDAESADNESADNESADNESADNESADNESADNESADNESADNESADNESADNETLAPEIEGASRIRPIFVWSYIGLVVPVFMAYVCLVGGDFMAMGRFFAPVVPLIIFAAQEGLRETFERPRRAPQDYRLWRFALVALVLLAVSAVNARYLHRINNKMTWHRWGQDTVGYLRKFADDRIKVGRWLRRSVPKNTYVAVGGAGAIVYASRLKALDTYGLNDSWVAHNGPRVGDRPGHSKLAPWWYIQKQKPDLICLGARHQDWPHRPSPGERASLRRQGLHWVCIDPPGLAPRYYCCRKRRDRDLNVWPKDK